jgi:GAF domain-containing protein
MTTRLREILESLEKRVEARTSELLVANEKNERRAKQFESIAQVSRTISSTENLDNLLAHITTVINHEYGFYHVGIFLVDDQNQYASLRATNSDGGLIMLRRGHRLKVGEQGIVGFVTSRGEPRIALNVGQDAVFFNNPDLPETRSELALPLKLGGTILGALDLQSMDVNAFSQEDVSVLSILADQVAIAIQNARSAEQAQRALIEAGIATKQ